MKILTNILILSCCFFAPLYSQEIEYKERATSTVQGQESQVVLNDINNLSFLVKRSASWYSAVWPKPDHYEYIQKDSLPVRWDITCFPLKVYSKPLLGNKSKAYLQFICQATSIWNEVAQDIGLGVGALSKKSSYYDSFYQKHGSLTLCSLSRKHIFGDGFIFI